MTRRSSSSVMEVMQTLLTYNQEDCLNMKYLEESLRNL